MRRMALSSRERSSHCDEKVSLKLDEMLLSLRPKLQMRSALFLLAPGAHDEVEGDATHVMGLDLNGMAEEPI